MQLTNTRCDTEIYDYFNREEAVFLIQDFVHPDLMASRESNTDLRYFLSLYFRFPPFKIAIKILHGLMVLLKDFNVTMDVI